MVDLSLTIAEDLPCYWEGHQPFQHKTWNWFADQRNAMASVYSRGGPYATRWMAIDEHTGTHFDAPLHFIPPPDSGLPGAVRRVPSRLTRSGWQASWEPPRLLTWHLPVEAKAG
ncbi:cyclase family protein [Salinispora arenicola]|uniref:cyclase family protein n=1 Tax=Salinispora arenicola TaxID=168697 RepID=UPI0027DE6DA7|nr:cyclase family protein [Salinispora arenicola]